MDAEIDLVDYEYSTDEDQGGDRDTTVKDEAKK